MLGSLLVTVFAAVHGALICDMGKYGQNCDLPCSLDCGLFQQRKLPPCDRDTGKCLHGCVRGRHGDHCDQLCSQNCIKTTCNQGNGGCTLGCIDGYTGYFCNITTVTQIQTTGTQVQTTDQGDTTCDTGKYGRDCDLTCSERCGLILNTNLRPCHRDTGTCSHGCVHGRHGDHCVQLCSQNCIKTTCDQRNGGCTIGCIEGYRGYFCNTTTGEGHITQSMHWMWMFPVAVLTLTTICCWKSPRFRRTFDRGFTWLIRRKPRPSSSDPSQDVSRSEREPLVPLTTQDSDHHASSDPSQGHSQSERGPWLSTASRATPLQADYDLFYASKDGDLEEVKRLLSTPGVDVNCRVGVWSRTPVMAAAWGGHREMMQLLVSKGADVSLLDVADDNILHFACRGGDVETVEYVLSLNVADINSRGVRSKTPVMRAAVVGHRDVVELLVSKGADALLFDDDGNNTLHFACMRGDVEMVEFVLSQKGVDIDAMNISGDTAADLARLGGHQPLVKLLKSRSAQ